MRILIIGGGVAGLTLAAELLQQGRTAVIVEKAAEYTDVGYGLGLYPLGSGVLHGLGRYKQFLDSGVVSQTYEVADGKGKVLQSAQMQTFTADIGPLVMISRTDLIDILRDAAGAADFRMGTTVTGLDQSREDVVGVTLSDGTQEDFDLVVAADGIYSQTRTSVFGHQRPDDTGWVLWTWWAELPQWPKDLVREYWGRGSFFGVYPCKDRVMCAAGTPADEMTVRPGDLDQARQFVRTTQADLIEADPRIGAAIDEATGFFPWPMADVRAEHWSRGRVVLCGDAAVGFLPTAGVGASNAMRGAAGLADELSRVGPETVPLALELFEKRCRKVIEDNQQDSRSVAKYMFVDSGPAAWGRDQLLKIYPAEKVVQQIIASMKTPF